MYLKFVLFSVVLERAMRFIPLGRFVRGFASRRAAFEHRIAASPFWIFPLALLGLSDVVMRLVAHARALDATPLPASNLPLAFVYVRDPLWRDAYAHVATLVFLAVCAQSLMLALTYMRVRARPLAPIDLAIGGLAVVAFLADALGARVLESTDMYSYVANAHLGMARSYGTAITIDDPALRAVTTLTWGTLPPSPYGPLWHVYNRAIADVATLGDALLRLRLANVCAILALIAGLLAARVSHAAIAIVAFNPYLYAQFVVNGHNDLLPVVALVLGIVFVRRSIWLTVIATIAAGLVKLPLAFVGLATFLAIRSARTRIALGIGTLAAIVGMSLGVGGRAYVAALTFASQKATGTATGDGVLHAVVVALALGSLAFAFATRRRYWPAALGVPTLGAFFYPWYLLWLVPLAFARRDAVAPIVVGFPVVGLLLSDVFFTTRLEGIIAYAILAVATVVIFESEASATNALASDDGMQEIRRAELLA